MALKIFLYTCVKCLIRPSIHRANDGGILGLRGFESKSQLPASLGWDMGEGEESITQLLLGTCVWNNGVIKVIGGIRIITNIIEERVFPAKIFIKDKAE